MHRRFVVVLAIGLFALPLSAAEFAAPAQHKTDPAAVQRYNAGYRYPQAGWIVLHIEGDPYTRGYQHGRLLATEIAAYIRGRAVESSPRDPANGWGHIRTLTNAVFLRKFEREYLEEMKGIADGAADAGAAINGRRIDLLDIAAINVYIEIDCLNPGLRVTRTGLEDLKFPKPDPAPPVKPAPPEPDPIKKDHCSAFIATGPATADGKIVFGHITMFGLNEGASVKVWLDIVPTNGARVVMQAFPGGIWSSQDYYMNGNGILLAETTIAQTPFDLDGAPLASRARQAIQYSKSIDDVVRYLTVKNNGLYTNEWLIGDIKTNEVAMYELGTKKSKLWRSSKDDWFGDTRGFYWGCNNTKDPEVRAEAMRPGGKGGAFRPDFRDTAWLNHYNKGAKIDVAFAMRAFTDPRLALPPSLDAKFTTSDMAAKLASHAVYGQPTGNVTRPRPGEAEAYPEIHPLVPHPWTVLTIDPPPAADPTVTPADITDVAAKEPVTVKLRTTPEATSTVSPAWSGAPVPKTLHDIWLAAGLTAYAPIAGWDAALASSGGSPGDVRRRDAALYHYRALWTYGKAAGAKLHEQTGLGVTVLHTLRQRVGTKAFDAATADFCKANDGKPVTTEEFFLHLERATGKDAGKLYLAEKPKLDGMAAAFTTHSFWDEPESCVIVYGTRDDEAANRNTANDLRAQFARKNARVAVVADKDATNDALAGKHVILIGRPSTNAVTAKLAAALPVKFGQGRITVGEAVYANAETLVIAAGANPKNPRYSVVVIAGLSAAATHLGPDVLAGNTTAEVLVCPAARRVMPLVVSKAK